MFPLIFHLYEVLKMAVPDDIFLPYLLPGGLVFSVVRPQTSLCQSACHVIFSDPIVYNFQSKYNTTLLLKKLHFLPKWEYSLFCFNIKIIVLISFDKLMQ